MTARCGLMAATHALVVRLVLLLAALAGRALQLPNLTAWPSFLTKKQLMSPPNSCWLKSLLSMFVTTPSPEYLNSQQSIIFRNKNLKLSREVK
mmetsp:Transcript_19779/g.38751  ORF Transcript_19779/g.38751 Transcript_19779/m.38751 type:complete len:93 (-) Transcript_19779:115-393(-)